MCLRCQVVCSVLLAKALLKNGNLLLHRADRLLRTGGNIQASPGVLQAGAENRGCSNEVVAPGNYQSQVNG
jgi:hypothetical protein